MQRIDESLVCRKDLHLRSNKRPSGVFEGQNDLRQQMEEPRPDEFPFYAEESKLCKPCAEKPRSGQMCKRCAESVQPLFCIEKERRIIRFNALLLVHLQGLEPWAH